MLTLRFEVQMCEDTGGYVARWDDPEGGGITTQGDTFAKLDAMVRDAVEGYFAGREKPKGASLRICSDNYEPGRNSCMTSMRPTIWALKSANSSAGTHSSRCSLPPTCWTG